MTSTAAKDAGNSLAWSMMQNMGWKDGQGLGKSGQGTKCALKPRKKIDNSGLGAQRGTSKWVDASCAYDAVISKLSIAYGASSNSKVSDTEEDSTETKSKKDKKEKKEKKEEKEKKRKAREASEEDEDQEAKEKKQRKKDKKREKKRKAEELENKVESEESEAEEPVRPASTSRHLFAKRLRSKQVSNYSEHHMAEIFATAQRKDFITQRIQNEKAAYIPTQMKKREEEDSEKLGEKKKEEKLGERCEVVSETEFDEVDCEEMGGSNKRIKFEGGFTEDTQVSIYNQAMESQIKNRTGLGLTSKLSKSKRREKAQSEHMLMMAGSYLSRKFVYAGTIEEVHRKRV